MSEIPKSTAVEFLRDAAATRVETTSLRGTAREMGLSPTGLKKFLLGTAPYSPTMKKLRKWYIVYYTKDENTAAPLAQEAASAAVAVLVSDLSVQTRPVAVERVLDALSTAYTRGGIKATWMNRVKAEYGLV